ncbi:MAG: putative metal-binding motif-containing protein [Thermodesulfobacteriota bacterium]
MNEPIVQSIPEQACRDGGARPRPPLWLAVLLVAAVLIAGPALAAPCPDADGDGFAVCSGGCTLPEGKQCGDCNDQNAQIRPGVAEFCGDGIDNNCDGAIDFGAGQECTIGVPTGCQEPSPETPCCLTRSILVCNAQGTGVVCPTPATGLEQPLPELAYSPACHDGVDNDCDSRTDAADPGCTASQGEQCNDLDDDFDELIDEGFFLGLPCTAGTGDCARSGTRICDGPTATRCSANPGAPANENTPGTGACVDGQDNDCDGAVDLADSGCSAPETCDGKDNDGDGLVDEGFAGLGGACTSGLGICQTEGTVLCSPDGQATVCSATPGLASVEGPAGATCEDGLDNDCDGSADALDPDCGAADWVVSCALPYYRGRVFPGFHSCVGLHRVLFFTNVNLEENPDAVLTAELLAMDEDGTVLAATPVANGDLARLASRIDREDWYVQSVGTNHKVFAPRPTLHVTLDDGKKKAEAFCSNIPWLQVIEPKGKVVVESEGDTTRLFTAIPLVDTRTVEVRVDGVSLFPAMGIANPGSCTVNAPCNGTVVINGRFVGVREAVVQSSSVWLPAINTVDLKLDNLGCGEHIFLVEGIRQRLSFPNTPDEQCLIDDLADKGTSSGLSIEITHPEEMAVLSQTTVQVVGSACSGRPISDVAVNGQLVDVSSQVFTEGDGLTSGDRYDITIDSAHPVTNLAQDVASGDIHQGSFDPGSNRLTAMVADDLGNRSFDQKVFAIGNVVPPQLAAGVEAGLSAGLRAKVQAAAELAATEVNNAFVVGMEADAIQRLFDERCHAAAVEYIGNLESQIINTVVDQREVEVTVCSCDPTVTTRITDFSADPNQVSCPVQFLNDKMKVTMNLPPIHVELSVGGSCRVEDPIFGACIAKTNVSGTTSTDLTASRLEFEISEGQLLGTSPPAAPVYYPPTASEPPTGNIHISIGCLASLCDFLLSPFAIIVNAIAGDRIIPVLGFGATIDVNFEADLGSSQPDPISLGEIKVDEQEVQGTGQKLQGILSSVSITPQGLVAGLKGNFETLSVDPEVEPTPGAISTPAPIPSLPTPNADDVFVALADDTFNQFFASMAVSGRFKTGCEDTGKTLGDLLPVDCASLSVGACSEDSSVSCKTDSDCTGTCIPNDLKSQIARGTCYAFKNGQAFCDSLPLFPLTERLTCQVTAQKLAEININASQGLLFCNRQDVPPRLLIQDNDATPDVETTVRLNDLSVALVVDRDGDGALAGELPSTHRCLAQGAPTVGDCNFFGACLDLNVETGMQLATKQCANDHSILCSTDAQCAAVGGGCVAVCDSGDPGFVTRVVGVQTTIRSLGTVCGGATGTGDDELLADTSGQDTTIDLVLENANRFTPPACIQGLDLGGFLSFSNPRLISIDTDGDPTFDDYLGLTGQVN